LTTCAVFQPLFTGYFDEIRMVVTVLGNAGMMLDNMTFSEKPAGPEQPAVIPLPAGGLLLLGGLGVLAAVRRRG
jgi:hypothetical protein